MVLLLPIAVGCGSDGSGETDESSGGTGGAGGASASGGAGGGATVPAAGVPADGCAAGFEHDGDAGCHAVLPAEPCPAGAMAVPGETLCRPVSPCGSGTWGTIPVEADTVFVDGGYAGGSSDGTAAHPYTTVAEGVLHAAQGAIVAIAEGSYLEELDLLNKSVVLWGRCPELVEIVGGSGNTTILADHSSGGAIRDLAVRSTGGALGIGVTDSVPFTIERVWIHHTSSRGVEVQDTFGPATVVLSDSLIEQVTGIGVNGSGSNLTVTGCVIRDVGISSMGRGRGVQFGANGLSRGIGMLQGSLIERVHDVAVSVFGSDLTVDATAVRDTLPFTDQRHGLGLMAVSGSAGLADLTLTRSTVERALKAGLAGQGATITVDATTFRQVRPEQLGGAFGRGLQVQSLNADATELFMTRSLVQESIEVGVLGFDSPLHLDGVLVRDIAARADGMFGDGVSLDGAAVLELSRSVLTGNARAGVTLFGAQAVIGDDAFRCNPIHIDGEGAFDVNNVGGNSCGCDGQLEECRVLSSNIEPPLP